MVKGDEAVSRSSRPAAGVRATTERQSDADRKQSLEQVGTRLRTARKARGLSLREMARRIKVSPSFVSQVETGKASPSVGTLYALVNELDLSLDELMAGESGSRAEVVSQAVAPQFADPTPLEVPWAQPRRGLPARVIPLQPAQGRSVIKLKGVTWERLTHEEDPNVEFLHVTYSPGSSSCPEDNLMRHGGHEYGHVIVGRLDVQVGFEIYELGPGDSVHFDSMTPHRLVNLYKEPCTAIWVVVGRESDHRHAHLP